MSTFVKQMQDSIAVEAIAREIFYAVSWDSSDETLWPDLGDDDKEKFRTAAMAAWNTLNQHEESE